MTDKDKKWTPEPWSFCKHYPDIVEGATGKSIMTTENLLNKNSEADIDRVIECVNSCADIPNPAAIKYAVDALEAISVNGYGDAKNTARDALYKMGIAQ